MLLAAELITASSFSIFEKSVLKFYRSAPNAAKGGRVSYSVLERMKALAMSMLIDTSIGFSDDGTHSPCRGLGSCCCFLSIFVSSLLVLFLLRLLLLLLLFHHHYRRHRHFSRATSCAVIEAQRLHGPCHCFLAKSRLTFHPGKCWIVAFQLQEE
mgnify:CR=1 FL=1